MSSALRLTLEIAMTYSKSTCLPIAQRFGIKHKVLNRCSHPSSHLICLLKFLKVYSLESNIYVTAGQTPTILANDSRFALISKQRNRIHDSWFSIHICWSAKWSRDQRMPPQSVARESACNWLLIHQLSSNHTIFCFDLYLIGFKVSLKTELKHCNKNLN